MPLFREGGREQTRKEKESLSHLVGEADIEKLASFEAGLGDRQNETLFKITLEIENTENALKEAEQLFQRLKKRMQQLKDLQRILSR